MTALVACLWASLLAEAAWGGTVYTQWGSSACTRKGATVYSGYIGGSHYTIPGAGSNYLCLTSQPVVNETTRPTYVSTVYGTEYEVLPLPGQNFDTVCAVCFINSSTTVMVPGTSQCPGSWQAEYTGILMSGYDHHAGSTEFICVNSKKEARTGSDANLDGRLLYYATAAVPTLKEREDLAVCRLLKMNAPRWVSVLPQFQL